MWSMREQFAKRYPDDANIADLDCILKITVVQCILYPPTYSVNNFKIDVSTCELISGQKYAREKTGFKENVLGFQLLPRVIYASALPPELIYLFYQNSSLKSMQRLTELGKSPGMSVGAPDLKCQT